MASSTNPSHVIGRPEAIDRKPAWVLRLYVIGQDFKSQTAEANLRSICDHHLKENYFLEIIDLLLQPHMAEEDRIFAVPTLIRRNPGPIRKIIGDLTHRGQVLTALGLAMEEPEVFD